MPPLARQYLAHPVDIDLADGFEGPVRRPVLVDQQRPHAFAKIAVLEQIKRQRQLGVEAVAQAGVAQGSDSGYVVGGQATLNYTVGYNVAARNTTTFIL